MAESATTIKKGEIRNPKGRGKGVRDRKWDMMEACIRLGYNPVDSIVISARDATDPDIKKFYDKLIIDRIIPVIKSIEHKGEIDSKFSLNVYYTGSEIKPNDRA